MCVSGGTISIILGISSTISICVSSAVSVIYTLMGGLYSVAYTDVVQLCLIFIGMVKNTYIGIRNYRI